MGLLLTFLFSPMPILEVDQQDGDIRRVDAADTGGLAYAQGADGGELFCRLDPQTPQGEVVKIEGQLFVV